MPDNLWQNCVAHYDHDVLAFFDTYFSQEDRRCLLIAGVGFDPRSGTLLKCLGSRMGPRLHARLIKEERRDPASELVRRADENLVEIERYCANVTVCPIDIFADDNAVVGGRNAIKSLAKVNLHEFTDVLIDMSALSMGISFPLVSLIYRTAKAKTDSCINVHLAVLSNPELDGLIESYPNDRVSDVIGFRRWELYGDTEKARLWMPQLSEAKINQLRMIYTDIEPHDTCPILPFPSADPKRGDRIAWKLLNNIQSDLGGPLDNDWGLDPRNFVHADEHKPLDIYRTILRIDDERRPVFETFGGSIMILSPMGGKIPSVGALMAALERQFPVVYVEALAYNANWEEIDIVKMEESRMAHIWLFGDAYLRDIEDSATHE